MRDSAGEVKIYNLLKDYDIDFEEEYEFDDLKSSSGRPLRFDFCVYNDDGDIDYLIEYQGKQHYAPVSKFGGKKGLHRQKYNDTLKRKYCLEHNIRLVTIPYYDENKINFEYLMRAAGYL